MARTLLALAVAAAVVAVAAAASVTVSPPAGPITGFTTTKSRKFLGIPYAKGPSGPLRWQPPVAADVFSTPFDASKNAPGCPQNCDLPPHGCPPVTSEDCLNLNVFTPLGATPDSKLPVMLFIHGGQFKSGYAGTVLYDGENLVHNTNVILVVIQYRLGALGFLYTGDTITGNYGLLDQKLSLEWTRANIAAFGGDPDQITVFGQSAGAMSIASQLASPLFKGLYANALLESEPFGIPYRDAATWVDFAKDFAKQAGCDTSGSYDECLKQTDVSVLVPAMAKARKNLFADLSNLFQLFVPWTPTVGTDVLPETPMAAWSRGNVHDVPITIGTVENEGVIFVYEAFGKSIGAIEYDLLIDLIFGLKISKDIRDHYPATSPDARVAMAKVATESLFRCTTRNATLSVANAPGRKSPTFLYVFDHAASFGKELWGPNFTACWDKVCHAGDLPFVFAPNGTRFGDIMTAEEKVMSNSMQTFWTNFAKTGNPGTAESVEWPVFDNSLNNMLLETPKDVTQHEGYQWCNFWDSIGYAWAQPSK